MGRTYNGELTLFLRAHRLAAGLKLEYVARRLHVHANTVADWEKSRKGPPMIYLPELAREYGVSIEELFYPPKEVSE